jgi:hypothetical protein
MSAVGGGLGINTASATEDDLLQDVMRLADEGGI